MHTNTAKNPWSLYIATRCRIKLTPHVTEIEKPLSFLNSNHETPLSRHPCVHLNL